MSLSDPYLHYQFGLCYYNACSNHSIYEKQTKKKLKLVIGSLGLNGHFEYGGKNYTAHDFLVKPFDSHAWLEDKDGNVYDFLFQEYADIAKLWNKEVTFPTEHEIIGVSKKTLKQKYKLEYIKAPRSSQRDIWNNAVARLKQMNYNEFERNNIMKVGVTI
jgi:hypothetical protein